MTKKIYEVLGSYWLACLLLGFLFLLTFLGTIEQTTEGLFEVQKKYFESIFLVHWIGGRFPLPLPGVYLVLVLLFVNLVVGGIIQIRKSKATVGVLVIHVGILIMLAAGFVKLKFSSDGNLTLYPGDHSDEYESYYEWEVAIWDAARISDVKELIIPDAEFSDLRGGATRTFESKELPFKLELSHYAKNSRVFPKGPMWESYGPVVDNFGIKEFALSKEAETNVPALVAKVNGQGALLWGMERYPLIVDAGGHKWAIKLRKKRFKMPFEVRLDKFSHELYPNTNIAKVYKSEVTVTEGGTSREAKIEMNAPYRDRGLVIFQSSWGPQDAPPGTPLFSGFAVVENPSDQWPLISCIVIAIGMAIAFGQKLTRYVEIQQSERKK